MFNNPICCCTKGLDGHDNDESHHTQRVPTVADTLILCLLFPYSFLTLSLLFPYSLLNLCLLWTLTSLTKLSRYPLRRRWEGMANDAPNNLPKLLVKMIVVVVLTEAFTHLLHLDTHCSVAPSRHCRK